MPRVALAVLVFTTGLLTLAQPSLAAPAQTNFVETQVFGGLTQPTDIAFSPDGRVFVAEKSGLLKVFDELGDTSATVVADLRTNVHNFWDRGLLGMVLDPQFPQRPFVYLLYAHDAPIGGTAPRWGTPGATTDPCPNPPGATGNGCVVSGRLSRLQLSDNLVVGGEQVLIEDWCQQFPSHSVGGLAFGSDGALYVTGGDGASFNYVDYGQTGNPCGDPPAPAGGTPSPPTAQGGALRSQDLRTTLDPTTLDGSVLRIDPDTAAGLADNPLSGSADANARRIVATGLRNPFRLAPRPGTSQIFVGDVGWSSWEEINRIDSATDGSVDNFGWPCYEGNGRQGGYDGADLTICENLFAQPAATRQPFFTYSHGAAVVSGDSCAGGGSSSAGLVFYQGGAYPASYDGALFFADYSRRCVWVMFQQAGEPAPSTRQLFARSIDPVNLKIGPGGDLFIVDFTGSIRRLRYASNNQPPTAVAEADRTTGPLPLTVSFDGRASSDPDAGESLSYAWDLDGDGLFDDSFSAQPSWTYTSQGAVTARLRVSDSSGEFDIDALEISPGGDPPQATIATPAPTLRWAVGDTISFSGSASDPQQGTLPATALSWSLTLQHCTTVDECHSHPLRTWEGVSGGSLDAPDHGYPSHLELTLTATDSSGLTDSETVRLDPRTVDLAFRSQPAGLRLAVGGIEETTPFTRTAIVGSTNSVSAPSPQVLGDTAYRYASWSDGGARAHEFVAPPSTTTFTANYEVDSTPPSGLVAAFGFNEGAGFSVGDASPEGNVGTVSGASWAVGGRFGGALSFDGVNDWVTVPDDPSLDLSAGLTVEAWVRPSSLSGYRTVVLKEHPPGRHAYALYGSDGTGPSGEVWTGSYFAATGPGLGTAAWRHVAVSYSQSAVRLFVDGVLANTTAVAGTVPTTTGPLRIGGNAIWGSEFFAGLIDELRVYNRALSAAEIQADMNRAVAPDNSPPAAPPNLTATGGLGQVALDWDAAGDNVGVTEYHVHRGTSAGFTPAAGNRIAVVSSGTAYLDTGLAAGDYFYRVTAADGAGNVGPPSAEARGTATADTEPPTVAVTAPANGANVSDIVTVSANAGDNVGVAGVQFLVDGTASGAEDTTAPFGLNWDSRTASNGTHSLRARARDAAGNTTTSAPINVTVANTSSFRNEILATGFDLPTTLEFLPDGRMLVGELQGKIKVLPPPYTQADAGLFLQIANIGSAGVQQGIYDIALDPNFSINHFYYVFYTLGSPNHDRVSRFTANATLSGTVPGSEFVLYEDPEPADAEHHGGSLNFANDGRLLFTTGEHFDAPLSQLLTNPRGKVHRINRDGTIPTDNPFYDGAGPNIDTIWARGLRNPFRAYYDAPTGRYFIADVGGNVATTAVEEINLGVPGANYGWPNNEGPCSAPCTSPLHYYRHNGRDAAITGGFVYRGTQFPSFYRGAYFYADYTQNWIKGLTLDADGDVSATFDFEPAHGAADGPYGDIVYLAEGPDGALYYVDLGYSDIGGTFGVSKIRRIRYVDSNQPPVVAASADPTSGPAPLSVAFSSSGSSDPEGQPLTYSWTFGDGATSTEANPSHAYATPGVYQVRLEVSDGVSSSLSAPISISAGSAPTASILSPTDGTQFQAGDVIAYSGDGSDPDDGALPASSFTWNIDFLHDGHVHPGTPISGVKSGSLTIPTSGHDYSGNTRYRITLTVRDSSGLSSARSVIVQPRKVDLTFDTTPAGRTLYLDGIARATPFVYDTLVGFNHTVEARNQTDGGTSYTFASWSDGGAQQHTITVPSAPQSYTASFASSTPTTGLVAAFGFNEGAGFSVGDASPEGNAGTVSGANWAGTGRFGGALSFDGVNDWVTVPDDPSLDLSGGLTVEAWVRPTALSGYRTVVLKEHPPGAHAYALYASDGLRPSGEVFTGSYITATGPALAPNVWRHLAVAYSQSTVRLYVDGVLAGSTAVPNTVPDTGAPLRIGGNAIWGSEFFAGLIDELRVYNRALSVAEIQTDMTSPVGP